MGDVFDAENLHGGSASRAMGAVTVVRGNKGVAEDTVGGVIDVIVLEVVHRKKLVILSPSHHPSDSASERSEMRDFHDRRSEKLSKIRLTFGQTIQ